MKSVLNAIPHLSVPGPKCSQTDSVHGTNSYPELRDGTGNSMGLDGSLSNLNSKFLCLYQGRLGIGCHPWLRPSRSPSTSLSHHRLSIQEHLEVISDHCISPKALALHFIEPLDQPSRGSRGRHGKRSTVTTKLKLTSPTCRSLASTPGPPTTHDSPTCGVDGTRSRMIGWMD